MQYTGAMIYKGVWVQNDPTDQFIPYKAGDVLTPASGNGFTADELILCISDVNQSGVNIVKGDGFFYENPETSYTNYWQVLTIVGKFEVSASYTAGQIVYIGSDANVFLNDYDGSGAAPVNPIAGYYLPPAPQWASVGKYLSVSSDTTIMCNTTIVSSLEPFNQASTIFYTAPFTLEFSINNSMQSTWVNGIQTSITIYDSLVTSHCAFQSYNNSLQITKYDDGIINPLVYAGPAILSSDIYTINVLPGTIICSKNNSKLFTFPSTLSSGYVWVNIPINANSITNFKITEGYPPGGVSCFLKNAPVLTPTGYRRIDTLNVGDLVQAATGAAVPIQVVKVTRVAASNTVNPFIIPKGLFGATKDLAISPDHKVQVGDKMIEARFLHLQRMKMAGSFEYYNLELPQNEKMIVAGVTVESLFPIARVTVTMAEFRQMLIAKFGSAGPDILAKVQKKVRFLTDGRVEVPVVKT